MKKLIAATTITACIALCAAGANGAEPEPEFAQEPAPVQTSNELHPGALVYVPGFGWVPYEGPNHCEDGTDIYENGNKIGIMG